jgi:hypothetical protein
MHIYSSMWAEIYFAIDDICHDKKHDTIVILGWKLENNYYKNKPFRNILVNYHEGMKLWLI